jgi:hypothetical protein
MITTAKTVLLSAIILVVSSADLLEDMVHPPSTLEYTVDAQLQFPEHYREWIYLTSGFDMSYSQEAMQMGHHMFDNVFVNPEAFKVFVATGTWPDQTVLVLEGRRAEGKGSINQKGNFQRRSALSGQVGLLCLWRRQNCQDDSNHGRLLQLPRVPRRHGHHVRPVLSNAAADCKEQGHNRWCLPERGWNTSPELALDLRMTGLDGVNPRNTPTLGTHLRECVD